ncbi:hypothetical protein RJT34_08647 [Clitoria ternatea]|uniref:Uncharacterized protein n=1 Tax=Clitoria ternatea TaxID=43366 RepID=A0AAN9K623_CLITE
MRTVLRLLYSILRASSICLVFELSEGGKLLAVVTACNGRVAVLQLPIINQSKRSFLEVKNQVVKMSTMPTYQQQEQPPPVIVSQESSQHGSVGPVVGVMVVIIVLGVIAVMIGRLCSGRRIMGHGQYDVESWAERKCSTCIDGRINLPIPRPSSEPNNTSLPATPIHSQETKRTEQSSQSSPPN